MFPQLARTPSSHVEKGLAELGGAMIDLGGDEGNGSLPAGLTYFGQFIDHDLTLDLTPLDYAHPFAEQTPNYRTPFLDLDHVYAGGPDLAPFLYEMKGAPGNERFLIGRTILKEGRTKRGSLNDLPRNANGIALVGDARQDENLILAQLHVAFLKFHNFVMDELEGHRLENVGPANGTRFEQARRIVTWTYQYIVLNDFLRFSIGSELLKEITEKAGSGALRYPMPFSIPLEFSVAAFRFGHSIVRDRYTLNTAHDPATLLELIQQTGVGQGAMPALREEWVIDWTHFFNISHLPQNGRKIDTTVARTLHDLPLGTVELYKMSRPNHPGHVVPPKNKLPVRTLWRSARAGLPSGQDVAKVLVQPSDRLTPEQILTGEQREIIHKHKFEKDTPLWYYVLKEGEFLEGGAKLGPIGSQIVGSVIVRALCADPNSYLSLAPDWEPVIGGHDFKTMAAIPRVSLAPSQPSTDHNNT
jgi:hypothetical protein